MSTPSFGSRQSFWQLQEKAQTNTGRLLVVFIFVVVTTVIATILAFRVGLFFLMANNTDGKIDRYLPNQRDTSNFIEGIIYGGVHAPFPSSIDLLGAGIAIAVILGGAIIKKIQLSSGGQSVAHMLGGRQISRETLATNEKRLLNVVEEMSIASGIPMPPVYLLDAEPSINAFAAGLTPSDAVLGFSKGSLDKLTRDELQGVVAHEFSHVFNGDMKMNMQLLGWIGGLQGISHIGRFLIEATRRRSSSSGKNDNAGGLILFGIAIMAIGGLGSLMASLVKAAVSRQREYLADATALQYTRNPEGIGGVLVKLLQESGGMQSPFAKEASHFLFSSSSAFASFSTHPPLADRANRVAPELFKRYESGLFVPPQPLIDIDPHPDGTVYLDEVAPQDEKAKHLALTPAFAAAVSEMQSHTKSTVDAAPLIAAMFCLDNDESHAHAITRVLSAHGKNDSFASHVINELEKMRMGPEDALLAVRFDILLRSVSTLRVLPVEERREFVSLVRDLMKTNGAVSIFEAAALIVIEKSLVPQDRKPLGMAQSEAISILISAMAYLAGNESFQKGFQVGNASLASTIPSVWKQLTVRLIQFDDITGEKVYEAIAAIDRVPLKFRKHILVALETCAMNDRRLSPGESELLRLVGLAFDLPSTAGHPEPVS